MTEAASAARPSLFGGRARCYNSLMNERVKQISDQAKALTPEELEELVDDLMLSLPEPDADTEKAWAEEAERRLAAVRRGEAATLDADEVFAGIREQLSQSKPGSRT